MDYLKAVKLCSFLEIRIPFPRPSSTFIHGWLWLLLRESRACVLGGNWVLTYLTDSVAGPSSLWLE
jgi:hypothetical protein